MSRPCCCFCRRVESALKMHTSSDHRHGSWCPARERLSRVEGKTRSILRLLFSYFLWAPLFLCCPPMPKSENRQQVRCLCVPRGWKDSENLGGKNSRRDHFSGCGF